MPRYILRPYTDNKAQWTENPVGAAYSLVDDVIEQPTAPNTGTDCLTVAADAQLSQHNVPGVTLAANEQVVSIKGWAYGKAVNGSNYYKVITRAAGVALGQGNYTTGSFGWFSVTRKGSLTQAQVNSLSIEVTSVGTSNLEVDALYIELFTTIVGDNNSFYFGVNPGGAPYFAASRQRAAGVQFDNYRIALNISTMTNTYESTSTFMNYFDSIGVKPLVGVVFNNSMPTQAQCQGVGTWLDTWGDKVLGIEFGNEDSGSWNTNTYLKADEYALRCVDVANAINHRCKLLIQGDIGSTQPGGLNWRDTILDTVPNIEDYIDGWTIHRYQADYELFIQGLINNTTKPVWVTEMGFASDNGNALSDNYAGWPVDMTWAQAATNMQTFYDTIRAKVDVAAIFVFGGEDSASHGASTNKEYYFGVQAVVVGPNTLSDKGAYTTTIKNLITTERNIAIAKAASTRDFTLLGT